MNLSTRLPFLILAAFFAITLRALAQSAVSSSAGTQNRIEPDVLPANPPNQGPLASPTPHVPSLDALNEAFKQTSLGKPADEARLHVQLRELSNRTINDPDLVAAHAKANAAGTDLEKRNRLRLYYNMYYDRLRAKADSEDLKNYIDARRGEHLIQLAQNRVRPSPTAAPSPSPARKREAKAPPAPEPPLPQ